MPKTLVIDDDPEFERAVRAEFNQRTDHQQTFIFANSEADALHLMQTMDDIDIVLVSIDNNNIGGITCGMGIFQKLTGRRMRVPRIALTGNHDLPSIRTAMNQGAVDFLTKPVSMDDLLVTLDKVFADCEVRRRAWKTESQLAAVRREMDLAGALQKRILPSQFPISAEMELYAQTDPAQEMGGDFYDFFDLPDGKTALVVADVSGKGVPAAFYMAVARTLFRATAQTTTSPAACLTDVNTLLVAHDIPNMFVTAFYAVLDSKSWKIEYANAGHLPPFLVRADGSIDSIDGGDGVVLGFDHGLEYEQDSFTLNKGDGLFIYTDGLTEAFDENRTQFSEQRLMECLLENRSLSAHALTTNVFAFVNSHTGGEPQSDDITSLVIRRF